MGLFSGRLRISGSSNFRDWFHFDAARPTKKKAIVLETDFKIYKRLWVLKNMTEYLVFLKN